MRQRHCDSAGTAKPVSKRLVQSLEHWRSGMHALYVKKYKSMCFRGVGMSTSSINRNRAWRFLNQ